MDIVPLYFFNQNIINKLSDMKKYEFERIKLGPNSKAELESRQMNFLKGGVFCSCSCGCLYSSTSTDPNYYGGSSTNANMNANYKNSTSKEI